MIANRILYVLVGVLAFLVVPLQMITTLFLGLLVRLSFGILLLPITLIWVVLAFPMIGASWLTAKIRWLRTPIGFAGIPWAILADIFVALMPSMGELESRAAKQMLAESWPYSWEYWRLQSGKLDLSSPECTSLREVINRITRCNPLLQLTISRIVAGEALDPNV